MLATLLLAILLLTLLACCLRYFLACLQAMTMVVGEEAGLARGELQGALSSLRVVGSVLAPFAWARLYEMGVKVGRPGQFYFVVAAIEVVQLVMSTRLGG